MGRPQACLAIANTDISLFRFHFNSSQPMPIKPLAWTLRGLTLSACLAVATQMVACTTLAEKSNVLSDERLIAESAGALGLTPTELKLQSRSTSGTNTYVVLRGKDGKEYSCTINGGNLLSFGMVNPPTCQRK